MDITPEQRLDAEGMPDPEGAPPGIDVDTAQEGIVPPADHPIAAGADPAYAVTAEEERVGESVADRARREEPDVGSPGRARRTDDAAAVDQEGAPLIADPTDPDDDIDRGLVTNEDVPGGQLGDEGSPGPEETAMHIRGDDDV